MLWQILSLLCIIPAFIGCFFIKRINKNVYPFIYSLVLSFVVECVAIASEDLKNEFIKNIAYNVFLVANFALLLYFFLLNNICTKKQVTLIFFMVSLFNIVEVILYPNVLIETTSFLEAAIIVIGCIKMVSNVMFYSKEGLVSNFYFVVAAATVILSLYDMFDTLVCYIVDLPLALKIKISVIFKIVNATYYIVLTYAFAKLIWKKK